MSPAGALALNGVVFAVMAFVAVLTFSARLDRLSGISAAALGCAAATCFIAASWLAVIR